MRPDGSGATFVTQTDVDIDRGISGNGGAIKNSENVLSLSTAASTYGGPTTGSGVVQVNNGGTFGGTGSHSV